MTETQRKIATIIESHFGCHPMTDADFHDPQFLDGKTDSLDSVELIMAVEHEFNITISDAEADPFNPNDLGTTRPLTELCAMVDGKLGVV